MRIFEDTISFLEVPGETSLTLGISGCPNQCPGCSWAEEDTAGEVVTLEQFRAMLDYYVGTVTVVTFLGGEWLPELKDYLGLAKGLGFKTCLYSGQDSVEIQMELLDYLKTGDYREELGGLESEKTNQKFIDVKTGECLNQLFRRNR